MNETELITKCLNNDTSAQSRLYSRFAPKMFGVCLRYADDYETAKDYLQEAFISVFTMLHTYSGNGSFEGWIRRIVVNTALQNLRKNSIIDYKYELTDVDFSEFQTEHIIESISAGELVNIIATLPKGFRTVFNLYAIEGYSHKEIAEMLDISEEGSRSQYSRARKSLQKMIAEEYSINV